MAAVYKIIDDFYDDSFVLIAIHSSLEDYKMGYRLNNIFNSKFKRSKSDFDLKENHCFPWFDWLDELNDNYWVLIANQSTKQVQLTNNDLFENETTYSRPKLIPEYKDVDYFLKIEDETIVANKKLIKTLMAVPKIRAAYQVSTDKLKSKKNLIF